MGGTIELRPLHIYKLPKTQTNLIGLLFLNQNISPKLFSANFFKQKKPKAQRVIINELRGKSSKKNPTNNVTISEMLFFMLYVQLIPISWPRFPGHNADM